MYVILNDIYITKNINRFNNYNINNVWDVIYIPRSLLRFKLYAHWKVKKRKEKRKIRKR